MTKKTKKRHKYLERSAENSFIWWGNLMQGEEDGAGGNEKVPWKFSLESVLQFLGTQLKKKLSLGLQSLR